MVARRRAPSAAALLLLLLPPLLARAGAPAAGAAAQAAGPEAAPGAAAVAAADARPPPACEAVAQQLAARHGLSFPSGLAPVAGTDFCRGTLASRSQLRPRGGWVDWNISVALHLGLGAAEQEQRQRQQPGQEQEGVHDLKQEQQECPLGPQAEPQAAAGAGARQPPPPPLPLGAPAGAQRAPAPAPGAPAPRRPGAPRRPSVARLAAEHPSAGGIYLSNLLCMPRLTLLWQWLTGEWRSVQAAVGGGAAGVAEGGAGAAADGQHYAARAELSLLKAVQHLLASGYPHPNGHTPPHVAGGAAAAPGEPAPPPQPQQQQQQQQQQQGQKQQPSGREPGAVSRLVSPPFGGSDWEWLRFWMGWLAAPGVLVALQVAESSGHEPWFVVHVAWLGLLRLAAEGYALYVAAFTDLSSAEQLDKLVVSHAVPSAVHLVLAALQAMFAPLMPRPLLLGLFWLRCLVAPLLNLWAVYSSWLPEGGAGDRGALERRRRRRYQRQQLLAQQHAAAALGGAGAPSDEAAAAATAIAAVARQEALQHGWQPPPAQPHAAELGAAAAGAGAAAAAAAPVSRPVHWPPPLFIPRELDDLPDAPEAFRCPITLALMREPTQATSGITYERTAIVQWLENSRFDPVTHAPLRRRHLSPNLTLRVLMEPWLRDKTQELRRQKRARTPAAAPAESDGGGGAAPAPAAAGGGEGAAPGGGGAQGGERRGDGEAREHGAAGGPRRPRSAESDAAAGPAEGAAPAPAPPPPQPQDDPNPRGGDAQPHAPQPPSPLSERGSSGGGNCAAAGGSSGGSSAGGGQARRPPQSEAAAAAAAPPPPAADAEWGLRGAASRDSESDHGSAQHDGHDTPNLRACNSSGSASLPADGERSHRSSGGSSTGCAGGCTAQSGASGGSDAGAGAQTRQGGGSWGSVEDTADDMLDDTPPPPPRVPTQPLKINTDLRLYRARLARMMANLAQDGGDRRRLLRESEAGLRRCLESDPTDPRAYVSLGKILLLQKRFDEARKLYADGTSNTGNTNAYIWAAWGYLEYRAANVSRARKLFDAAIVVDETHAAAWHKWGMLEMRQGNFLRARDLWTRGIQKCRKAPQKSNTYLYCSLAVMAAELGKLGEARSWFEEGTRTNLGKTSCALWHAWAMMEAQIGDASAVRFLFKRSLQANPRSRYAYLAWGMWERKQGNLDACTQLLARGQQLNPADAALFQARALAARDAGRQDEARAVFKRGLEVDGSHLYLWQAWGVMEYQLGRLEEARRLFQEGVWADPGNKDVVYVFQAWGVLEWKGMRNHQLARELFKAALKVEPRNESTWATWIQMEEELGRLEAANDLRIRRGEQQWEFVIPSSFTTRPDGGGGGGGPLNAMLSTINRFFRLRGEGGGGNGGGGGGRALSEMLPEEFLSERDAAGALAAQMAADAPPLPLPLPFGGEGGAALADAARGGAPAAAAAAAGGAGGGSGAASSSGRGGSSPAGDSRGGGGAEAPGGQGSEDAAAWQQQQEGQRPVLFPDPDGSRGRQSAMSRLTKRPARRPGAEGSSDGDGGGGGSGGEGRPAAGSSTDAS
ncbi:MAG: hypothetical protein J3K34DRAFT_519304 [Monoraphidium minutum]|nr:MAG: hypothetical protein J3K34DRAFT_519304 [Monoraphidium minutum]